jgi:hypothetical protein
MFFCHGFISSFSGYLTRVNQQSAFAITLVSIDAEVLYVTAGGRQGR